MRISARVGFVFAIILIAIAVDLYYSNAVKVASETFDFGSVIILRPILLVAFYLLISKFVLDFLGHNERNLFLSLFLISVGVFLILLFGLPVMSPISIRYLPGDMAEIGSSVLALTIHTGAIFAAVGLLRLLPVRVFLKK